MCFEVCCLVSNPRVTGGVRFVESIFRKFSPVGPDLFQFCFRSETVFLASVYELHFQRLHLVNEFFTHRFPKLFRLTTGKPGQVAT